MNAQTNSELGYELPKDVWLGVADRLMEAAPSVVEFLQKNGSMESAEDYLIDMQLAYQAVCYVADFARDKCRIITIPD